MTTEKPPRITLDTNVGNLVADPEQYAGICLPEISREIMREIGHQIRDAIVGGKIMAFVSEASVFIECLSFEDKLAYLDVAMTPKERPAPDPRRVAIFEEIARLGVTRACCMEIFEDVFGRWISFDHAIRTNFARPNSFIRLRDLTAITTSVARRVSWRDFRASPMTRL